MLPAGPLPRAATAARPGGAAPAGRPAADSIRVMEQFQIESVEHPLDDGAIVARAFRVLARVQMMSLWEPPHGLTLDRDLYDAVVESLHEAGMANGLRAWRLTDALRDREGDELGEAWLTAWTSIGDVVDECPYPHGEWGPARELLGDDLLGEVLSISASSLRRYAAGSRATPDRIATRLHAVSQITSALAGSYNDYGIRRWFERARTQLDLRRPIELLTGDWSPDDEGPRRVIDLAERLVGAGTAT
jgi:hypothetical protein